MGPLSSQGSRAGAGKGLRETTKPVTCERTWGAEDAGGGVPRGRKSEANGEGVWSAQKEGRASRLCAK